MKTIPVPVLLTPTITACPPAAAAAGDTTPATKAAAGNTLHAGDLTARILGTSLQ